jgi:hypothetical protein
VVGLLIGHRDGEHDAVAQAFGDAAGAHADIALDDVGLLETRVVVVEHDRIFLRKRVAQDGLVHGVPEFGVGSEAFQHLGVVKVFVDLEMFGLHDFKIEVLVPGFVAAEILRRCGGGSKQAE